MGSDCDDVGALAILHHYANQEKATILGVIYSSGKIPHGTGIIDAINTYYQRPDLPIGAEQDTLFGDPTDKMDAIKLAQDTLAYGHDLITSNQVPNQVQVARKLLASQADNSVTYLTVGHTKGLHDLLKSTPDEFSNLSGMELVTQKVNRWIALGALRANNPDIIGTQDWNFFRNNTQPYTKYVVENFPKPAYFINAGADVISGQILAYADAGNIVRTVYRDWLWKTEQKVLAQGRPSWDLAAVDFAVEGQSTFFETPEKGILQFDVTHGSKWKKSTSGPHYFVNQKENVSTAFGDYLNAMLAQSLELNIITK